ncbi:replication protein A 70 kDa DNA-binding subunit A-like [Trifolium pratense]|nr:replication protein A 70 kDa DNA-binding subunit A-like [Trifolium pratense]XP_045817403.1 replication protein A 70 kDa DNA-binding subunit A-like [Trifolium pratense]
MSNPNDGNAEVDIPPELLITNFDDPIGAIVQSTYPNLLSQYQNGQFVQSRAILASTVEAVDQINDYVLKILPGEEGVYYSADSIDSSEINDAQAFNMIPPDMIPPEFLNILETSDIPNHKLTLKVGTTVTLLTDLDPAGGLYNGTRLIVTRLAAVGKFVLVAKRLSGENIDEPVFLLRVDMSPSRSPIPYKLVRRQYPISVSFAMAIEKSQGQSLDSVGLYIPRSVISHDQLKVAFSSVKSKNGLKILIDDKDKEAMSDTINDINAVFKEVFKNLNKIKEVFLNDLSGVARKSTVKVRITRLWDTWNINKRKGMISIDMVLMDEKHNYIHGTIPSRFAHLFKDILQEGKIYVIDTFTVLKNKETYIIVENNTSMLQFSGSTNFTPQEFDDGKIPRYVFEFVHFEELHKRDNQAHADVIGVIINITPIEERTSVNGKTDIMSLYLRNESGDILKVTLWDGYVSVFDKKLKKYKHATIEPNVAIFTSILVKQYKGEFFVQSSRSTTIYINIDIPEAIELAQSSKVANVMDESVNLPLLVVHPKVNKVKTISEILDIAASGSNMNDVYHCAATVDDILVKNGWYYVSCPDCRKTVSPTETGFKCDHCKVDIAYPKTRFRLELQVKDRTATTIFVLFDEVAEQVVQVKLGDLTSNLENGNGGDSELPGQLLNIIGSTHVFQVKMSSYFESLGRQSFTANTILKLNVKVEQEDTVANICSSSSGPSPILEHKRRKLILHSLPDSGDMDQKDIVEDLDD